MRLARVCVIATGGARRLDDFTARWVHVEAHRPFEVIRSAQWAYRSAQARIVAHAGAMRAGFGPVLIVEDVAHFTAAFTLDGLPDPPPGWRVLHLGAPAYVVADPRATAGQLLAAGQGCIDVVTLPGHWSLTPPSVWSSAVLAAGEGDGTDRDDEEVGSWESIRST